MGLFGKLLCRIGLHAWGRARFVTSASSNVRDYSKRCSRCGETRRWIAAG